MNNQKIIYMKDFEAFFQLHQNINTDKIAIAFSGGSDSLCLLYLLSKKIIPSNLVALYVNHKLRAESELDVESVLNRNNCEKLGVKYIELNCNNGEIEKLSKIRGAGIEDAARVLRYQKMLEYCFSNNIKSLATAHNSDDQVETMIMRTFNGASPLSLSCIKSVTVLEGVDVIRPVLLYSKQELRDILIKENFSWSEDSTNGEEDYLRNKIRANIVPLIHQVFPSAPSIVLRNAELIEGLNTLVNEKVKGLIEKKSVNCEYYCNQVTIVRYNVVLELTKSYCFPSINQLKHIDSIIMSSTKNIREKFNGFDLVIDINKNVYFEKSLIDMNFTFIINESGDRYIDIPYSTLKIDSLSVAGKKQLLIADEDLHFPLVFRSIKAGDQLITDGGKILINKLISSWKIDENLRKLVYILEDKSGIVAVFASHVGGRDRLARRIKKTLVGKSVRIYSILNKDI
ncbi:MAG: tRNA lysidine(34) synthetase TilS [Spirochaetaceae bacterium]|nr:tRNA lysidine(34) synthetase TilS [Spirochaetaceae bacterium]